MNLPRLAVTRPVTTLMVLVSVLVIGGIATARLPLGFLPQVDVPFIGITIPYPNSNPTQIEKEIIKPVEEALSTLSGVKKLSSTATADDAEFQLEFKWGQELDIVRMHVSEKMDQVRASLPAGVGQILIFSFNTSDIPVVQGRIAAQGVDLSRNYDLLETRVVNRIRRVPGVARVDLNGVAPREINIDLVLDRVKEHRVDVGRLIQNLQGASGNLVLGQVRDEQMRYTARAVGAFASLDAIGELPVDARGLKLGDIAVISYEEPPINFGRHLDGKYAVALDVFKESTANTVEVVRAVHRVIEEDIARDPLLAGIQLFTWDDQAEMITNGISGLRKSGLIGGLLAVAVLYFFLRRLDSTIIVSLAIPFSVIAASAVLYFNGKTLNVLSMMGLMLGVGMLVDNAIVVLESIDRVHQYEPDVQKAALEGANAVALAVTTSTLASLIVFLPLIVGSASELTTWLGEVGIAISLAIGCSLFASLTLIPLVSAHFLKAKKGKPVKSIVWLQERYARILAWTLRRRLATFWLIIGFIVLGILPFVFKLVPTGMFAANKNERLRLSYEFADFTYKSDAERVVRRVEEYFQKQRQRFDLKSVYSFYAENEAVTVLTFNKAPAEARIKELRQTIRPELPEVAGTRLFFDDDAEEGGNSTYFAVKFFGQDSEVLRGLAEEAERRLNTVVGVEDVSTGLNRARREIQVTIDREKARRHGLDARDVSDIFAFTLGGMRLRRFNAGEHEVETWLALRPEDRENLEDLKQLQIGGADGVPVPLGDVASFHVVRREQEIRREDRRVRMAVRATYEGKEWDKTKTEISGLMDALELPAGYTWSYDDRILEQEGQDAQMGINFLLALALVYIVMASLFESLVQPFAILFAVLFALPGATWLLAATRTPFNLMAQIGLLILMGIVVNNGIVLLDHMNQLRRAGVGRHEAVLQAGRDRLRPVLMTAGTTILGLLPLAIGGETVGGLFYYPLARTVMGGLLSSTLITLVVLPYIALGFENAATWAGRLWARTAPGAPLGPAAAEAGEAVAISAGLGVGPPADR
jgi:hydrophobic/amphiphilic exporter-1 (mainly G- bacteria), HAE1 family